MKPVGPEVLALFATLFVPAIAAGAAPELTPKGIYHAVDELERTGVKFFVELEEKGGSARRVGVTHGFRTGDRFTFNFEINRDTYIYVVNETFPDTAVSPASYTVKGIERQFVVEKSPPPRRHGPATWPRRSRLGEPRLLFPTARAGSNNRLKADRPYPVPHRGHYVMDDQTGLERLYLVISDRRLDFSASFSAENGRLRGAAGAERLRRQLAAWKGNAQVEFVDKGIVHDVASYGVSIDPAKPAVVEIDLRHCR